MAMLVLIIIFLFSVLLFILVSNKLRVFDDEKKAGFKFGLLTSLCGLIVGVIMLLVLVLGFAW